MGLSDRVRHFLGRDRNDPFIPDQKEDEHACQCKRAAARRRAVLRGGKLVEVSEAPERETR